jgi:hypothetical protein
MGRNPKHRTFEELVGEHVKMLISEYLEKSNPAIVKELKTCQHDLARCRITLGNLYSAFVHTNCTSSKFKSAILLQINDALADDPNWEY